MYLQEIIVVVYKHWLPPSIDVQDVSVETHQESTYEGKRFDGKVS
jgi:hypothetical protein